ncbi:MAG: uroporphyrinogen decarboxylase family protein [Kiritimatiellae bacterium]|nr:uroporphyrinogen decarboxylase family protein [Kiritimatiellia bacterium]MDD5522322.1 uroporphyrinogen decarboxylase family protein [Kiritimatiellia bacterium]
MTSRERLLATLRGEIPDRVPVSPFVQEEYLSWYYPQKSKLDRVIDAVELANELDFDLMAKHRAFETPHFFRRSYTSWELRNSESRENGMIRRRTEIITPGRTLTQEEVGPESGAATSGVRFMVVRYLLQDSDDMECFLKYMPPLSDQDRREISETASAWQRIIGTRGVLAPWGWAGTFNFCADLCGLDNFYVMPYENETLYRELMGKVADAMCSYNTVVAETAIDCIGFQGHMANSTTTSSDFFRNFVQPYEKRVINAVHGTGKFTVYHNCGYAKTLYENYRELGMTVWETVAEPPRGDNRLAEVKAAIGNRICLLGNIDQVDFLKHATPAEVDAATRQIVRTGKPGGRFIFSTSDYLEKGTPRENVVAMIEAAKDEGRYN